MDDDLDFTDIPDLETTEFVNFCLDFLYEIRKTSVEDSWSLVFTLVSVLIGNEFPENRVFLREKFSQIFDIIGDTIFEDIDDLFEVVKEGL